MKKGAFLNFFTVCTVLFSAVMGFIFFKDRIFVQRDPLTLEREGKLAAALDAYIRHALRKARIEEISDFKADTLLKQTLMNRNSTKMIDWLLAENTQTQKSFYTAISGIDRVRKEVKGEQEHFVTGGNKSCDRKNFQNTFVTVFGAANSIDSPEQKIGFITIRALSGYTYDLHMIDKQNGKVLHAVLYPENKVSFPVNSKEYILSVQGKVTFQNGQKWKSLRQIISFDDIEEGCVSRYSLKTKVRR